MIETGLLLQWKQCFCHYHYCVSNIYIIDCVEGKYVFIICYWKKGEYEKNIAIVYFGVAKCFLGGIS